MYDTIDYISMVHYITIQSERWLCVQVHVLMNRQYVGMNDIIVLSHSAIWDQITAVD